MKQDPHSDRLWRPIVNHSDHALHTSRSKTDLAVLWHCCLGHAYPDAVIQYLESQRNIKLSRRDFTVCDACSLGKLRQAPSTPSFHRASRVLDIVHSDLIGPINPNTNSGFKYILTCINDYTRYNTIYLLKNKNDTFIKFQHYKSLVEKQTGAKIMKLKTD